MNKISQLVNFEPKECLPEIAPPNNSSIAILIGEVVKGYLESGFPSPEEDVVFEKARIIAEELPEIPPAWLPRVFTVARREIHPNPQVFHLLKAWRQFVIHERREKLKDLRPKPPEPPQRSEEEIRADWRQTWLEASALGFYAPKGILDSYGITREEIEAEKIKLKKNE